MAGWQALINNFAVSEASFTGADISVGHSLAWGDILGLIDANPALKPYYERLSARPAFQKVYAEALSKFKARA